MVSFPPVLSSRPEWEGCSGREVRAVQGGGRAGRNLRDRNARGTGAEVGSEEETLGQVTEGL